MDNMKELLELAAKAAGYVLHWTGPHASHPCIEVDDKLNFWSPSHNDGDSRRLQAACRITVGTDGHQATANWWEDDGITMTHADPVLCAGDPAAAMRLVTLQAAAEQGRRHTEGQ